MDCNKCGQTMKFESGCVMGSHGVNYENCMEPSYVCKCGNITEALEPKPPTTSNSDYTKFGMCKRLNLCWFTKDNGCFLGQNTCYENPNFV